MSKFDINASTGTASKAEPLPVELQPILTPQVQAQFVYNINPAVLRTLSGNGGAVTHNNTSGVVSTGTASDGFASIDTIRVIQHHPGQASIARYDGKFISPGVDDCTILMGCGNPFNGLFFGYDGPSFGVLRRSGGIAHIQRLTITDASVDDEDITIMLDDTAITTVPVTSTGDVTKTAKEIAEFDYLAEGVPWLAFAVADTVIYVSTVGEDMAGTYQLSDALSAVGTFALIVSGVPPTDTWTHQDKWNVDKMLELPPDGLGPSGVDLNPQQGNVYDIRYEYPRFGNIVWSIENPNTGDFTPVHRETPNNQTEDPSIVNPSFPLHVSVQNFGNTTDISASCATMCGFLEGQEADLGPSFSAGHDEFNVGILETEIPVLTIRNKIEFQGQVNATRLKPMLLTLLSNLKIEKETTTFRFYAGAIPLNGTTYTDVDAEASTTQFDISSTEFDPNGIRPKGPIVLGSNESAAIDLIQFNTVLGPGVPLVVTAQVSKGFADNIVGADITWNETI